MQHQVSSAIGVAAIQNNAITIPDLVKKAFEMVRPEDRQESESLQELYDFAVNHGGLPEVVDPKGWEEEWWNDLQRASFPSYDVSPLYCPFYGI